MHRLQEEAHHTLESSVEQLLVALLVIDEDHLRNQLLWSHLLSGGSQRVLLRSLLRWNLLFGITFLLDCSHRIFKLLHAQVERGPGVHFQHLPSIFLSPVPLLTDQEDSFEFAFDE